MENINTDLGKDFDISKLYIGIYESKKIAFIQL